MEKIYITLTIQYDDITKKTFGCGCAIDHFSYKQNNVYKSMITKNVYCDFHNYYYKGYNNNDRYKYLLEQALINDKKYQSNITPCINKISYKKNIFNRNNELPIL